MLQGGPPFRFGHETPTLFHSDTDLTSSQESSRLAGSRVPHGHPAERRNISTSPLMLASQAVEHLRKFRRIKLTIMHTLTAGMGGVSKDAAIFAAGAAAGAAALFCIIKASGVVKATASGNDETSSPIRSKVAAAREVRTANPLETKGDYSSISHTAGPPVACCIYLTSGAS